MQQPVSPLLARSTAAGDAPLWLPGSCIGAAAEVLYEARIGFGRLDSEPMSRPQLSSHLQSSS